LEADAGGDVRVPDARAVAVQRDVMCRRQRAKLLEDVVRIDRSPAAVVRLLDGDGARRHGVIARVRADLRLDRGGAEQAAGSNKRAGLDAALLGQSATFVADEVSVGVAQQLLARWDEQP